MGIIFHNNATTTLASDLAEGSTSVQVQGADADRFPSPGASEYFDLVIEDRTTNPIAREVCRCVSRSGAFLTVERAQQETTARDWPAGVLVSNRVTTGGLTALRDDAIAAQRFLGAFATAPTRRNNGAVLQEGDAYFDTVTRDLFVHVGGGWASTVTLITGDQSIDGSLSVGNDITVGGTLVVEGSTTLTGPVHAGGDVTVDGTLTVAGDAAFSGDITCDNLTAVHEVSAGTLDVSGDGTVGGLLAVDDLTLGGQHVVTTADMSGAINQQMFPAGTTMKWGTGLFTAGRASISYDRPFPNATILPPVCQIIWPDTGSTKTASLELRVTHVTAAGFDLACFRPYVQGTEYAGESVVSSFAGNFSWFSIGA